MGTGGKIAKTLKLSGAAIIFLVVIFFASILNPNAKALNLSVTTPENPIIEISLSAAQLNLNLTPKADSPTFGTANLVTSVATNNLTGYVAYMSIADSTLTRTQALESQPLNTPTIPSLTPNAEGYTESSFTRNHWGYRIGDGNWLAIPSTDLEINSSTSSTNGDPTTISFASKVDMSLPAGSYATDIDIIAITNTLPVVMQDIDTWRGSLVANQAIRAIDERDGRWYWVTKLQTAQDNPFARTESDGKKYQIWMTQNLDLDLDSSTPLTSTSTDLNVTGGTFYTDGYTTSGGVISWTPIVSTTTNISDSGYDGLPYSLDAGTRYTYKDASNISEECNGDNCMHWHVGNYYTGGAAVATNNIDQRTPDWSTYNNSICPKNWRLPTGPLSDSGYSDFNYLLVQHGIIDEYVDPADNTSYSTSGYSNIQDVPLYITRSGYWETYRPKGMMGVNVSGGLYSNVTGTSMGVYGNNALFFNDSYVTPVEIVNEDILPMNGLPVRCIARNPDIIVTFDANGGIGTMAAQNLGGYDGGTLNSNAFTRTNYNFVGWNTAADGSGTSYSNGATYSGASTTLYAQWEYHPYIQNFTTATCPTTATVVYDNRDETSYHIQKLADGKCWMLDNLALDLTNSTVKSKLSASNTNATATSISRLINGGGSTSDQYATAGVSNWTSGSGSYTAPLINMNSKDVVPNNAPTGGAGYNRVGGYYNYCAASAGSYCYDNDNGLGAGSTTEDICPKNWRIPTTGTFGDSGTVGDYGVLANAIYGSTGATNDATAIANYRNILSLPFSGEFYKGSAGSQGTSGYFWSSMRGDNIYMRVLVTSTTYIGQGGAYTRTSGFPIRCLSGT